MTTYYAGGSNPEETGIVPRPAGGLPGLIRRRPGMPGQSPTGGPPAGTFSPIAPASDLRGQQINPAASGRLAGIRGQADSAANAVLNGPSRANVEQGATGRYARAYGTGIVRAGPAVGVPGTGAAGQRYESSTGSTDEAVRRMLAGGQDSSLDTEFSGIKRLIGGGASVGGAGGASSYDSDFMRKSTAGLEGALAGLSGGPDRTALALQTLKDFEGAGAEQFEQDIRKTGQATAKFGRGGSGMAEKSVTDLTRQLEIDRARKRNELAAGVAEGDIADRFRRADTFNTVRGTEAGNLAGMRSSELAGAGLDLEARTGDANRAQQTSLAALDAAMRRSETGSASRENMVRTLADLEGSRYGQAQGLREEERGERDYTTGVNERNEDRRFRNTNATFDRAEGFADRTIGDRFARAGFAADREGQVEGSERADRDEYRFERGRQDERGDNAIDRARQERLDEEDIMDRIFNRDQARYGGARDIANIDLGAAGVADDRSAGEMDSIQKLISNWFGSRSPRRKPGAKGQPTTGAEDLGTYG